MFAASHIYNKTKNKPNWLCSVGRSDKTGFGGGNFPSVRICHIIVCTYIRYIEFLFIQNFVCFIVYDQKMQYKGSNAYIRVPNITRNSES